MGTVQERPHKESVLRVDAELGIVTPLSGFVSPGGGGGASMPPHPGSILLLGRAHRAIYT